MKEKKDRMKEYAPGGAVILSDLGNAEANKKYGAIDIGSYSEESAEKAGDILAPGGVIMADMGKVNVAEAAERLSPRCWEVLDVFTDDGRAFVVARMADAGKERVPESFGRYVKTAELERMIEEEQAKKQKALKVCAGTSAACALLIVLLAWRFNTDEAPLYLLGAPVMFIGACIVLAHGKDYVNAQRRVKELRRIRSS